MTTAALDCFIRQANERARLAQDYERAPLHVLGEILTGAKRFVDVGANKGVYSYVANCVMRNGQIISIEADPGLASNLRREVTTWENNNNQITVLDVAAGDQECVMPFRVGVDNTQGSLAASDWMSVDAQEFKVPVKPLDSLLDAAPSTVFKIDVEGFEYRVLCGATNHLSLNEQNFLIELHGWGDASASKYPPDVFSLMRRRGYKTKRIGRGYNFLFTRAAPLDCWAAFLQYAPLAYLKAALRRMGLRRLYYSLGRGMRPGS